MKNWVELMDQKIDDLASLFDSVDRNFNLIHGNDPIVKWGFGEDEKRISDARKARKGCDRYKRELVDEMNFYREMKKINWN